MRCQNLSVINLQSLCICVDVSASHCFPKMCGMLSRICGNKALTVVDYNSTWLSKIVCHCSLFLLLHSHNKKIRRKKSIHFVCGENNKNISCFFCSFSKYKFSNTLVGCTFVVHLPFRSSLAADATTARIIFIINISYTFSLPFRSIFPVVCCCYWREKKTTKHFV